MLEYHLSDIIRNPLCRVRRSFKLFGDILVFYNLYGILFIIEDKTDVFLISIISCVLKFRDTLTLQRYLSIICLDISQL